jgi:hypothetical protein
MKLAVEHHHSRLFETERMSFGEQIRDHACCPLIALKEITLCGTLSAGAPSSRIDGQERTRSVEGDHSNRMFPSPTKEGLVV